MDLNAGQVPVLLSVIELGGYPNLIGLYQSKGFEVVIEGSVRKALASIKRRKPDIVVAEFNFQSDFRDRSSNLESLLAVTQRMSDVSVVIFYDEVHRSALEKLLQRFPVFETMAFPVKPDEVEDCLDRVMEQTGRD